MYFHFKQNKTMLTEILFLLRILVIFLLFSCNNASPPPLPPAIKYPPNKWYDSTKAEILRQANKAIDSTAIVKEEENYRQVEMFSKGNLVKLEAIRDGRIIYDVHYANNGDFELRCERLCDNGGASFEGIVYKNEFYGYTLNFYCSGQVKETYFRYKSKTHGTLTKYNEDGTVKEVIDNGLPDLMEAPMPDIFN